MFKSMHYISIMCILALNIRFYICFYVCFDVFCVMFYVIEVKGGEK